ncbi:hypothetical protein [Streptosporangium vulgare]|uniref:Uncharacterized protein n=2 Tax=Streptosporangium vulgare TaxID=46190 RepID=A0ABV5TQ51_9ACTN
MIEFTENAFFPIAPKDRGTNPDATAEVFDRVRNAWVPVYSGQWVVKGVKRGTRGFYPISADDLADIYDPA